MDHKVVSCIFLLLLLVLDPPRNAAREMEDAAAVMDVLRLPSADVRPKTEDVKHGHSHGHSSSHMGMGMPDMATQAQVFFLMKDLKVGTKMNIYLPHVNLSKSFNFLPKQQADSIPFSSKALPSLLRFFSYSQDSPQAIAMKDTLSSCEATPLEGEVQYCATSSESLLDFARSVLGSNSKFEILRTAETAKSSPLLQRYTVLQTKEIKTPKVIACHNLAYPYPVYFCHSQKTETKVFIVTMEGENGDRVDAVSACHMDTSQWDPHHTSFRLLKLKPGTSEICHFFPADHLVFVKPLPTL